MEIRRRDAGGLARVSRPDSTPETIALLNALGLLFALIACGAALALWVSSCARSGEVVDGRGVALPQNIDDPKRGPVPDGLDALKDVDPSFSRSALRRFVLEVARRGSRAAVGGDWAALAPFVSAEAAERWALEFRGVDAVGEVLVARVNLRLLSLERVALLEVDVLGSRLEQRGQRSEHTRFAERWTLQRVATAPSLDPEAMEARGCPTSGEPVDLDEDGCCRLCQQPQRWGHHQWQVVEWRAEPRTPLEPPPSEYRHGGCAEPLWVSKDLGAQLKRLASSRRDFDLDAVIASVGVVHELVMVGLCAERVHGLRALCTDVAWDQLRFELQMYLSDGVDLLRGEVELVRVEPMWVDLDAHYASVTFRLWWRMQEVTVAPNGALVDGEPAGFVAASQCWTFCRRGPSAKVGYALGCPSCGASFDGIDAAGVCGGCRQRVTDGRFSWLLDHVSEVGEIGHAALT